MDTSKRTVYVGGLAPHHTAETLLEVFSTFGTIVDVQLPRDPTARGPTTATTSQHRGFGFIEFASADEAKDAVDNMHLNELPAHLGGQGRPLKVTLAKPVKGAKVLGSDRPVWSNEEYLEQYGSGEQQQQGASEDAMDSLAGAGKVTSV